MGPVYDPLIMPARACLISVASGSPALRGNTKSVDVVSELMPFLGSLQITETIVLRHKLANLSPINRNNNLYNSVCVHRHKHINSSVSAPLNATRIAVMRGRYSLAEANGWARMFIFDLQMLKKALFCTKWLHKACSMDI